MKVLHGLLIALSTVVSIATASADESAATQEPAESPVERAPSLFPEGVVYKNASCGCCTGWLEHMENNGFDLTANNVDNLQQVKERVGIPFGMGSCHTTEIGGYFVEGHVPAEDVRRLLTEKPKAKGLTVPAMPIGSPGMESGDRVDPYEVLLVHEDGTTSVYAKYPKEAEPDEQQLGEP
jgi:hypothetical protein